MTQISPADYYRSRERQERQIAHGTIDRGIAAIHLDMATRYAVLIQELSHGMHVQA